jgi:hypothetical protein
MLYRCMLDYCLFCRIINVYHNETQVANFHSSYAFKLSLSKVRKHFAEQKIKFMRFVSCIAGNLYL